jgi:beta-aspartyl-peptidase (threonine type)
MATNGKIGYLAGSANARVGFAAGSEILRNGGTAMDAAIAAVRCVEDNLEDQGVGTGGVPNVLGEVELDATIMDGRTLATGAVGAIKGYPNPIEIARKVMEETPHVMLVGEGAELFAETHGFTKAELLTPESKELWRARIVGDVETESNMYEDQYSTYMGTVRRWKELLHERILGTTNVMAKDMDGNIACAVSTSGWGFKWPGRLGDSPVIGAGNYADNRYGAAACTGRGEMAIRACSAHSVVTYMRFGMSLEEALKTAMEDLSHLVDPYAERLNVMNIVAMDKDGNAAAASTAEGAAFVYQTTEMDDYEEKARIVVPVKTRTE